MRAVPKNIQPKCLYFSYYIAPCFLDSPPKFDVQREMGNIAEVTESGNTTALEFPGSDLRPSCK